MNKRNTTVKTAAKIILGSGLVYYVFFHTKMVDFAMLQSAIKHPANLLLSLVFLGFSALMCACRWYLLVRAQKLDLSFKDLFELTMIGNFFNTFMPGSVGGDLIKAWYVAGQEPQRKTRAIFTVILDRFVGLSVILLYAAVTLFFFTEWLEAHNELKALALSLWIFLGAVAAFSLAFFTPILWQSKLLTQLLSVLKKSNKLGIIVDAALLYQNHRSRIVAAIFLSALSIFGTSVLYSLQGGTLGLPTPMSQYFFIIPVGLTVSAVPLLPGGIGVGQVAFYKLFEWTGSPNPELGATLCTLMQAYTILFNCIGAFFYLKFKKKPKSGFSLNAEPVPQT